MLIWPWHCVAVSPRRFVIDLRLLQHLSLCFHWSIFCQSYSHQRHWEKAIYIISTPKSLMVKRVWLFKQWQTSAGCSFICCNRYSVKKVFHYYFFSKFCQVYTYFDMFYYLGHQGNNVNYVSDSNQIFHSYKNRSSVYLRNTIRFA